MVFVTSEDHGRDLIAQLGWRKALPRVRVMHRREEIEQVTVGSAHASLGAGRDDLIEEGVPALAEAGVHGSGRRRAEPRLRNRTVHYFLIDTQEIFVHVLNSRRRTHRPLEFCP